jgi:hypothetical protein
LPPGCDVVDVVPSEANINYVLSHWRVSGAGESQALTVEFREALQAQSPKQIEIIGRWTDMSPSQHIPLFPIPLEADDWQILLVVNPGRERSVAASSATLRPIAAGQVPSHWSPHRQSLGLSVADPALTWFAADGASPDGELVITPTAVVTSSSAVPSGVRAGSIEHSVATYPDLPNPPALSLKLHSEIPSTASMEPWHEARYSLSGNLAAGDWTFELPQAAVLDAVIVNGEGFPAEATDGAVRLTPLPPDAREIVVRFRTPAAANQGWLRSHYQVPLPRWNVPTVSVNWSVGLPAGRAATAGPLGTPPGTLVANTPWLWQAFAPWRRPASTPRFDPLSSASWRSLFLAPDQDRDALAGRERGVAFIFMDPPSTLELETLDQQTAALLSQVLLIACLMSVVVIRRVTGCRPRVFAGTAAIVLAAATGLPMEYVSLAGGCVLGLVAGGLLPSRWVQQRDPLSPLRLGRRSIPATAAVSAALMAIHIEWHSPARAQQPRADAATTDLPSLNHDEVAPESSRFDVLVPYRDEAISPVGYVEDGALPRFADWLRRDHVLPPYLFRTVQYQVSESNPELIRAVLDVVVLSEARRIAVVLPFREIAFRSPDDCEVDGRRTQVRPAAIGEGFVVEVEPARPAAGSEAAQHGSHGPRQVEIAVWFRMVGGNGGDGFRCRIPPVNAARLHLPAAAARRGWRTSSVHGTVRRDEQGNLDCGLGGIDWISMTPASGDGRADALYPSLHVDATTLVEIHPMRLQARTRVDVSPRSAEAGLPLPRRLNLLLPGRAEVRQVQSDSLREFRVWQAAANTSVLAINFDQPLVSGQAIEFDYTVPFDSRAASELPAIPLLEGDRLLRHRIGLRAAPGMKLVPDRTALVAGRLQELLPDSFQGPSPDAAWSPPDAAYSVLQPTAIPIRVTPLEPGRSVAVEQTVTIESRTLRLEAQAHIEVTGTYVFEHQLAVPSELRIDALSVEQDDANRLLDWSRDGDRLVVHLREGRSGLQRLRLRGWLPLRPGEVNRFPSLEFQAATSRSSELILRNTSGQRVELFAEGGAPVLPGFSAPGASTEAAIKRFAGPGAIVPVSCRLDAGLTAPQLRTIAFLREQDERWLLTMTCRFDQRAGPPPPGLTVAVPRELAQGLQVTPTDIVHSSQVAADGALDLQLQWPDAGSAFQGFQLTASFAPATERQWTVPLPRLPYMADDQQFLVLSPGLGYAPDASTAVPFDVAQWSGDQQDPLSAAFAGSRSYQITADKIALLATGTIASVPTPPAFVETTVWDGVDGTTLGLTVVYLSVVNRPIELALDLPDAAHVSRVLDGDHMIEPDTRAGPAVNCVIHGNGAGGPRRIAFLWHRNRAASDSRLTMDHRLPTVSGLSVDRYLVTVVPPHGRRYVLRDAVRLETSEVYRLERAEQMMDWIVGPGGGGEHAAAAKATGLASGLDTDIVELSGVAWSNSRLARRFEALRLQWNAIRDAAGDDAPAGPEPDPAYQAAVQSQTQIVSEALGNPDAIPLRLAPGARRLDFWCISKPAVRAGYAALFLLALLALFAAGRVLRRRWPVPGDGSRADYIGLSLLGLFWWCSLRFGWLGLALAVGAAAIQLAVWLRKAPAANVSAL